MPKVTAKKKKKKDWYGLSTRIDKDGEYHLTIMKNSGDRGAYEHYIKKSKAYQRSIKKKK